MTRVGAPIGNQNARKAKIWEQAIKRALARKVNGTIDRGLDDAADQLIKAVFAGEPWALKEFGDRIDGKPTQQVDIDADIRNRDVSDQPLTADEWDRAYGDRLETAAGSAEGTD